MKRQHVILRLGTADAFKPKIADPSAHVSDVDLLDLTGTLDFGISEFMQQVQREELTPSEAALDLLVLATAIAGIDTRISRAAHSQDGWTREIHVYMPVADPALWAGVQPGLIRALNFLSGDLWTVSFRSRPRGQSRLVPAPKRLNLDQPDCLSMLSGGLDSCIGAIDLLSPGTKPLFVSHVSPQSGGYQKAVVAALRRQYGAPAIRRVHGSNSFPKDAVAQGEENTTRTRSFLFFSMAAYAASGFGRPVTTWVPENGFIALNVPLDPLRLGALSTRTAHPFYMARWNEMLARLGIQNTLENPYVKKTKGEMVAACADRAFLQKIVPETMSCAAPAKYRHLKMNWGHCGHCLPCLIRRGSLHGGKLPDATAYHHDLANAAVDSRTAIGEYVRSISVAGARLRQRPSLATYAIHKPGPLSDVAGDLTELSRVYREGMLELEAFLGKAMAHPR